MLEKINTLGEPLITCSVVNFIGNEYSIINQADEKNTPTLPFFTFLYSKFIILIFLCFYKILILIAKNFFFLSGKGDAFWQMSSANFFKFFSLRDRGNYNLKAKTVSPIP
ncbi:MULTISPECIES: hypothetical protein [Campylobacter]|uniref:hypothetical protein n=1 Tax=Campylobacter TaxID=194 RepID=UPI000A343295|nr:hypothetical protein [Campylobacter sp. P0024]MCR8679319.1 hypothetical protein [Campylobacter sp. RM19072]